MTEAVRNRIEVDTEAIEQGYKNCRAVVKKKLKSLYWVTGNLSSDKRHAIDALLWHLIQSLELLDLESPNRLPLDVWSDVRADVSDAFLDQCTCVELAALVDAARKYSIPKQYLFDMLNGSDTFIRDRKMETYDHVIPFAYRLGGATMAAAVSVLGVTKPGYEVSAIKCGKAVALTQMLASCVTHMKQKKHLLAEEDFEECEIVIHRLKMRQGGPPWKNFVRLYCSRIEKLFYEGGKVINYLDFDGQRTVKSLLGLHWKMLMNMRLDPEVALSEDGVLTKREMLGLRSRHLMGIEGNVPVIPETNGHH